MVAYQTQIKNAQSLTLDLTKYTDKDTSVLADKLAEACQLRKLKVISGAPTTILKSALSTIDLELVDVSREQSLENPGPVVYLNKVQKLRLCLEANCLGETLTNSRYPSISYLEIHELGENQKEPGQSSYNWVQCLSASYCINELRITSRVETILALPEHVSDSVSTLVYSPVEGAYTRCNDIAKKFPYLDNLRLYNLGRPEEAKSASRQFRSINPGIDVTYFDQSSNYFADLSLKR